MKIIEKYLLRNFSIPLIYISAIFLLLFIIIDVLGHLDEFIRMKVGIDLILSYYFNYLPIILVQVLPFAGLVAVIYSLNNLQRYNEITGMHSCGMGLFKIIRPYLAVGIFLSLITYILNEKVNPPAFRIVYDLKENFEKNRPKREIIENVTLYGKENRIIYAKRYDLNKKILYNLVILEHNVDQVLINKVVARMAIWEDKKWKLYGIILYRLDPQGNFVEEPKYLEDGEMELTESPQEIIQHDIIVEAMSIAQLHRYTERFKNTSEKIAKRFLIKLHQKRAQNFYILILILVGLPFGLIQREASKFICLGVAFFTAILFYGLNAIALGLANLGLLPPFISAWLVPNIFLIFSSILLKKSPH